MKKNSYITFTRLLAGLLLLLTFVLLVAVRLSEQGDIIDRNSRWILFSFICAIGLFIYSNYIPKRYEYKKKTTAELMQQIKKQPERNKLR